MIFASEELQKNIQHLAPTKTLYYKANIQPEEKETVLYTAEAQLIWQKTLPDQSSQPEHYCLLDQTIFYPEGGGQPADLGTINGIEVLDVQKLSCDVHAGTAWVLHKLASPLPEADQHLSLVVDQDHRNDYCQQHSAQHLLSAILSRHGWDTISVRLGSNDITIDVEPNLPVQKNQPEPWKNNIELDFWLQIEVLANRYLTENAPIRSSLHNPNDLANVEPLRRMPQVDGLIRLIQIDDIDLTPCGGVHCQRLGEIGLIKFSFVEKSKSRLRCHWLAGQRAYDDMTQRYIQTQNLSQQLSAPVAELSDKVAQLQERLHDIEYQNRHYMQQLSQFQVQKEAQGQDTRLPFIAFWEQEASILHQQAQALVALGFHGLLINQTNLKQEDNPYCWICFGLEVSEFSKLKSSLFELLGGAGNCKGGGKAPYWQGKTSKLPYLSIPEATASLKELFVTLER